MSLSPCMDCGTPCQGIRCGNPCQPVSRAGRTRQSGRDTAQWRKVTRPAVLARDGYRCRMGLPGCTTTATTVHRLRAYGPFHDANLAAYEAACRHCNSSEAATA